MTIIAIVMQCTTGDSITKPVLKTSIMGKTIFIAVVCILLGGRSFSSGILNKDPSAKSQKYFQIVFGAFLFIIGVINLFQ
jgi:hypothetical protein